MLVSIEFLEFPFGKEIFRYDVDEVPDGIGLFSTVEKITHSSELEKDTYKGDEYYFVEHHFGKTEKIYKITRVGFNN